MATPGDLAPLPASLEVTRVLFRGFVDAGPVPPDTFQLDQGVLRTDDVPEGGVVVETLYLSVDPCGWLRSGCGGLHILRPCLC